MTRPTQAVSIKSIDEHTITVAGYGVVFGGEDLEGDTFSADTDFMLDLVPTKLALYDHRQNPTVKHVLGQIPNSRIKRDEVGLWIEAELDRSRAYVDAIRELVESGALGWSSGSVGHLVERQGKHIKSWPIVEFSLTTTPAEPRTLGVKELKNLVDYAEAIKTLLPNKAETEPSPEASRPEADPAQSAADVAAKRKEATNQTTDVQGKRTMGEETKTPDVAVKQSNDAGQVYADQLKATLQTFTATLKEEFVGVRDQAQDAKATAETARKSTDELSDKLDQVLKYMQDTPAFRKAGYYTDDGGAADPEVKSFGDFLLAVARKDHKRLAQVYKSRPSDSTETKDLGTVGGPSGGYLVPTDYRTSLLQAASMNNEIYNRVTRIPVNVTSGEWPALDQYFTPDAGVGDTAFAGKVKAKGTPELTNLPETEPEFSMLTWRLHKIGGHTQVSNELINDSPQSVEALLTGLFGIAVGAKREYLILRGTGVGEPLGILRSPAAIGLGSGALLWSDVAAMYARFKATNGAPAWAIHPSNWSDILTMEVGTAGAAAWVANMQASAGQTLNGAPILGSEHLPQRTNAGSVLLADFASYVLFEGSDISVAYSEHVGFIGDKGTWRFTQRLDGQPWLKKPITLADPQGSYTVSPFVALGSL